MSSSDIICQEQSLITGHRETARDDSFNSYHVPTRCHVLYVRHTSQAVRISRESILGGGDDKGKSPEGCVLGVLERGPEIRVALREGARWADQEIKSGRLSVGARP